MIFGNTYCVLNEFLKQDISCINNEPDNFYARIKNCKNENQNIKNAINIDNLINNCAKIYEMTQVNAAKSQYWRKTKGMYFKNNEKTLNSLFANFSKDFVLEKMFEMSKWVRVETETNIWVVGIVYRNNKPAFLGVGQPWLDAVPVGNIFHTSFGMSKFYPISTNSKFGYFINFKDATFGKDVFSL